MRLWLNFYQRRDWEAITLSLAALVQACEQVHMFAHGKPLDEQVFTVAIQSLFVFDPKNVPDTFGGIANLTRGLTWLAKFTTAAAKATDREMIQYLMSILYLMRLMLKDKPRLNRLHERLLIAKNQVNYFHEQHPQVIASLADIYAESISSLPFRIQIRGLRQVLTQAAAMQTVRCLLLGGLRAAVLWQQVGGRRWQLLLMRQRLALTAKQLLVQANAS